MSITLVHYLICLSLDLSYTGSRLYQTWTVIYRLCQIQALSDMDCHIQALSDTGSIRHGLTCTGSLTYRLSYTAYMDCVRCRLSYSIHGLYHVRLCQMEALSDSNFHINQVTTAALRFYFSWELYCIICDDLIRAN